jgi:hypothetical protein
VPALWRVRRSRRTPAKMSNYPPDARIEVQIKEETGRSLSTVGIRHGRMHQRECAGVGGKGRRSTGYRHVVSWRCEVGDAGDRPCGCDCDCDCGHTHGALKEASQPPAAQCVGTRQLDRAPTGPVVLVMVPSGRASHSPLASASAYNVPFRPVIRVAILVRTEVESVCRILQDMYRKRGPRAFVQKCARR